MEGASNSLMILSFIFLSLGAHGSGALAQSGSGDSGKQEEEVTSAFEIPIFTEEFLDHNKAREAELRQLR